jgi:hypothetical protein
MTPLSLSKLIGAMGVLGFIVILVALNALEPAKLDPPSIFDPPLLIPALNTLFLALVPFAVTYISARGYLMTGSLSLLFLGGGMLAFGLGYLGAWAFVLPGGANIGVTIANVEFLVASILCVVGVAFISAPPAERIMSGRATVVYPVYLCVIAFGVWLTIASLQGALPTFFVPGAGGTSLRSAILGTAVGLFALSSLGVMRVYGRSRSEILYWYCIALALIAVGLTSYLLQRVIGGPIGWIGRFAQYLGSICLLIAVMISFRSKGEPS